MHSDYMFLLLTVNLNTNLLDIINFVYILLTNIQLNPQCCGSLAIYIYIYYIYIYIYMQYEFYDRGGDKTGCGEIGC